jgi:hypothetical protein
MHVRIRKVDLNQCFLNSLRDEYLLPTIKISVPIEDFLDLLTQHFNPPVIRDLLMYIDNVRDNDDENLVHVALQDLRVLVHS